MPLIGAAVIASAWDPGDLTGAVPDAVGPDGTGTATRFTNAVVLERADGPTTVTLPGLFDAWVAGLSGDRPDLVGLDWPLTDAVVGDDGSAHQAFPGGMFLAMAVDGSVVSDFPIAGPDADLHRFFTHADPAKLLLSVTSDNEVVPFIGARSCFADMTAMMKTATGPDDFIYLLGWYCLIDLELVPGDPTTALRTLPVTARAPRFARCCGRPRRSRPASGRRFGRSPGPSRPRSFSEDRR